MATEKTFKGFLGWFEEGIILRGQKVIMLHIGSLPAIFGDQDTLQ
jgi:1-aminocyclopropane-1-carboxylate deaminase/D-cysteine desulfhydrase-like pyridoxal-dependent ACC family enzyme|tara:strand:- start:685 stop:819 length:135 start_codon:yes stop_codon:yes gene_type:complete